LFINCQSRKVTHGQSEKKVNGNVEDRGGLERQKPSLQGKEGSNGVNMDQSLKIKMEGKTQIEFESSHLGTGGDGTPIRGEFNVNTWAKKGFKVTLDKEVSSKIPEKFFEGLNEEFSFVELDSVSRGG